jgi:hypothetical protein
VACLVLLRLCHLVLDGLDFLDRRHLGECVAAAECPLCAVLLFVLLLPHERCCFVFANLNAVPSFSCRWSMMARKTLTEAAVLIGRADPLPDRLPRANTLQAVASRLGTKRPIDGYPRRWQITHQKHVSRFEANLRPRLFRCRRLTASSRNSQISQVNANLARLGISLLTPF